MTHQKMAVWPGNPYPLGATWDGEGVNNTYCQDTPLSWHDWTLDVEQDELLIFVRRLIALRKAHSVFRRRHFFQGRPIKGSGVSDNEWLDMTTG